MIRYVVGDATQPQGDGTKVIAHVCNDEGGWGAGFVLALSRVSHGPEKAYRQWVRVRRPEKLPLGVVLFVPFVADTYVANMIAQRLGLGDDDEIPLQYDAIKLCLARLADWARTNAASVHMPRIGCGLAGGVWEVVGPLVESELGDLDVTVYDLPEAEA